MIDYYNRKRLALLLHARKYQHVDDNAHNNCHVVNCQFARNIWRHITTCTHSACTNPQCAYSRNIIEHWEQCAKPYDCGLCSPLRPPKPEPEKEPPKKFELPDCRTARHLISHYKNCSSIGDSCEMCEIANDLRRKSKGLRQLKRHSTLLKHSCCCRDKTCKNPMCIKMKRTLTHTNVCRTTCSESMVCREIAVFCLHHSISCTEPDCILSVEEPSADNLHDFHFFQLLESNVNGLTDSIKE